MGIAIILFYHCWKSTATICMDVRTTEKKITEGMQTSHAFIHSLDKDCVQFFFTDSDYTSAFVRKEKTAICNDGEGRRSTNGIRGNGIE